MKHGSCFSGIGGFDLAAERWKIKTLWQIEIDKRCVEVLTHHFKGVKLYDDIRKIDGKRLEEVDIVSGGFPCQDVSLAGSLKGLRGKRSGLWFSFRDCLRDVRPPWVVIENVPGLLYSNKGRDLATVLQGLAQLGYGVTYRVLDSRFFGVPQRRRRIFIVGSLGNFSSAEVLFEPGSGVGHPQPRSKATTSVARALTASTGGASAKEQQYTFIGGDGVPLNPLGVPDPAYTHVDASGNRTGSGRSNQDTFAIYRDGGVRRLTPLECERLQGFPDEWTRYGRKLKRARVNGERVVVEDVVEHSDNVRYRQLGNAVTVNVAEWIFERIKLASEG